MFFRLIIFGLITIPFISCSNNFLVSGTGNQIIASSPNSVTSTTTNTGSFVVSRVVKDATNPSQIIDLIGDGSGNLGTICTTNDGGDPNSTTSGTACMCTFQYSTTAAPNQKMDVPLIYHEANMVRCTYGGVIPTAVTALKVSIHVTTSNQYSNTVTFNFSGSAITLNPTLASTFQKANRYLCGNTISVEYLFDSSIYDPIQSEDPHFTYPLDYYTSNIGEALEYYVNSADASDSCPPIPDSSIPIFSKVPYNGNSTIYPPTPNTTDRSTFYLAKQLTGIFSVPVNAVIAPSIVSDATSAGTFTVAPPLGYGASPISSGIAGSESCPATTSIPTGYQWVKVWLFRGTLSPRSSMVPSSVNPTNVEGSIICNPGDWNTAQTGSPVALEPVFAGCQLTTPDSITVGQNPVSTTHSMTEVTANAYLADRVLGTLQCVELSDRTNAAAPKYPNACTLTTEPGVGCGWSSPSSELGGDVWRLNVPDGTQSGYAQSATIGCNSTTLTDPLGLCATGVSYAHGGTRIVQPAFTNLVPSTPFDTAQRYEFIYVVTPPNINTSDMLNQTASSAGLPFYPFRFLTAQDCLSSDPNHPNSATDCTLNYAITNFQLKLHDVGTNGDPPASDPNRAGVFPVCALQPIP